MTASIKLNLGCGNDLLQGFVNVDKFGESDVRHDLEVFPWPWEDNSVSMVLMNHVLEHLGSTTGIYFSIIRELYRICEPGAKLQISVPHPRHNDFLNDPTHVRPILPGGLSLFSKKLNRKWGASNISNSPLGLYLDVDFEIDEVKMVPDQRWLEKFQRGEIDDVGLQEAALNYNNVIREIRIIMTAIK